MAYMNVQDGNVNVVEQLRVVLDAVAAAEKHHDLLLQVLLEKGEKKEKAAVRGADDVTLLNVIGRRDIIGVVDTNVQRLALRAENRGRMSVVCVGGRAEEASVGRMWVVVARREAPAARRESPDVP